MSEFENLPPVPRLDPATLAAFKGLIESTSGPWQAPLINPQSGKQNGQTGVPPDGSTVASFQVFLQNGKRFGTFLPLCHGSGPVNHTGVVIGALARDQIPVARKIIVFDNSQVTAEENSRAVNDWIALYNFHAMFSALVREVEALWRERDASSGDPAQNNTTKKTP